MNNGEFLGKNKSLETIGEKRRGIEGYFQDYRIL